MSMRIDRLRNIDLSSVPKSIYILLLMVLLLVACDSPEEQKLPEDPQSNSTNPESSAAQEQRLEQLLQCTMSVQVTDFQGRNVELPEEFSVVIDEFVRNRPNENGAWYTDLAIDEESLALVSDWQERYLTLKDEIYRRFSILIPKPLGVTTESWLPITWGDRIDSGFAYQFLPEVELDEVHDDIAPNKLIKIGQIDYNFPEQEGKLDGDKIVFPESETCLFPSPYGLMPNYTVVVAPHPTLERTTSRSQHIVRLQPEADGSAIVTIKTANSTITYPLPSSAIAAAFNPFGDQSNEGMSVFFSESFEPITTVAADAIKSDNWTESIAEIITGQPIVAQVDRHIWEHESIDHSVLGAIQVAYRWEISQETHEGEMPLIIRMSEYQTAAGTIYQYTQYSIAYSESGAAVLEAIKSDYFSIFGGLVTADEQYVENAAEQAAKITDNYYLVFVPAVGR